MAEAVRCCAGGQVLGFGVGADEAQKAGGGEREAAGGEEQEGGGGAGFGAGDVVRAGFGEVALQPLQGDVADGNQAVFAAFALFDDDGALGGVEVVEGQLAQFSGAEAAGVEQFEDGAVAEAFGGGGVRRVD